MSENEQTTESLIRDLREGMAIKRWKALDKLGKMQVVEAVPSIITILKNAKISDVRRKAAETLGKIKSKDALRGLLETSLDKKEAGEVRRAAIKSTGELGTIESVPALTDIKKNGPMVDRVSATLALRNVATILGYKNVNALESSYHEIIEQKKISASKPNTVVDQVKEKIICHYCKVRLPDEALVICPYCNAPLKNE
ncbi:MAG: HEAT repeat domain-containing protein [Candidatus Heimdallarchaeota archaeon]